MSTPCVHRYSAFHPAALPQPETKSTSGQVDRATGDTQCRHYRVAQPHTGEVSLGFCSAHGRGGHVPATAKRGPPALASREVLDFGRDTRARSAAHLGQGFRPRPGRMLRRDGDSAHYRDRIRYRTLAARNQAAGQRTSGQRGSWLRKNGVCFLTAFSEGQDLLRGFIESLTRRGIGALALFKRSGL